MGTSYLLALVIIGLCMYSLEYFLIIVYKFLKKEVGLHSMRYGFTMLHIYLSILRCLIPWGTMALKSQYMPYEVKN